MMLQTRETTKGEYWKNPEYIRILADQMGEIAIKTNKPVNWNGGVEIE